MTTPEQVLKTASELTDRLFAGDRIDLSVDRHWFDQVCTRLALLAGDRAIHYVDHNVGLTDGPLADVLAIADDVVIAIVVDFGALHAFLKSTTLIPRNLLEDLQVNTVTDAVGFEGKYWPRQLKVELSYPDRTLKLPFDRWPAPQLESLAVLIPALVADLNK